MIHKEKVIENIDKYSFDHCILCNPGKAKEILKEYNGREGIGSYGGLNTDILYEDYVARGKKVVQEEICPEDDDKLGLRMPNFWPINQGELSISIATYYNWIQFKEAIKKRKIEINAEVLDEYGWVGMLELYNTSSLIDRLNDSSMPFFSVPKTLTECVRYLEGHESERLQKYSEFSEEIRRWAMNQKGYDPFEWGLGKEKSKKLERISDRPTNVKKHVKRFWKEQLLNKRYFPRDMELDIVDKRFSDNRNPDVVLIGESFLEISQKGIEKNNENISWVSRSTGEISYFPIITNPSFNKQLKNAQIVLKKYPYSKVGLLSWDSKVKKPFQLAKNSQEKEVFDIESLLAFIAYFDLTGEKGIVKELEGTLKWVN